MRSDSILGYALMGLLHEQPQSGYDLRKMFTATAMGSFSDSPGAIYPALARLERLGMVQGVVETSAGLRRRRLYRLTPQGRAALRAWLGRTVTRDDIMRRTDDLMLRMAFLDNVLGAKQTSRFLRELEREIEAYLPELREFLKSHAGEMPLSGRLALECGIEGYEARLQWARRSAAQYERGRRNRK